MISLTDDNCKQLKMGLLGLCLIVKCDKLHQLKESICTYVSNKLKSFTREIYL